MERFLLYLDDIDDLYGTFGLIFERLRRLLLNLVSLAVGTLIMGSGVVLALVHPPLALATCILLFVTLLYRAVTKPAPAALPSA